MYSVNDKRSLCVLSLSTSLAAAVADDASCLKVLSIDLGVPYSTLQGRISITNTKAHAQPTDVEAILAHTQDARIMDSICAAHGNAAWFSLPAKSGATPASVFVEFAKVSAEVGSLGNAFFDALADGNISADELSRLRKGVYRLHAAAQAMLMAATDMAEV